MAQGSLSSPMRAYIDRNSPLPYYVQMKDAIKQQIENGNWKPGDIVPGEPELCRIFDVSRSVVRQALKEMTYEGLVVRQKGKGTFVAEPKINESLVQKLTGFYQDMVDRGHEPVTQVLKQEVVPATSKIASQLSVQVGDPIVQIERLRFIQEEPILLVTTYIPKAVAPNLANIDLSHGSLYAYLEGECNLTLARGRRTIEAVPANEREATLLGVKKGAPLILLESVTFQSDGKPIEYYHALHRGDRSRFEVELIRIRQQGKAREALSQVDLELPPASSVTLVRKDR